MPNIVSRFARSWQLIHASCDVLRADNALLILPALSGLATTALAAGFVALAMSGGTFSAIRESGSLNALGPLYAWLFCWYVVQYFVVIFFNTALVGAAIALLDGSRPTVGAVLKLALSRIGVILGYAVISATVGVLLQALAERLGLIGRLIEATLGLAWTAATFLVVPILVDNIRHRRLNRSRRQHAAISTRPSGAWRRAAFRVDHDALANSPSRRRAVGDLRRGRLPLRRRRFAADGL